MDVAADKCVGFNNKLSSVETIDAGSKARGTSRWDVMPRRHAETSRCIVTIGRHAEMFCCDAALRRHVTTSHGGETSYTVYWDVT